MAKENKSKPVTKELSFEDFKKKILNDYRLVNESRQASLLGRKEVLTGKAKFGIFGDGKEVAQVAMAKVFKDGDFRSGYYRDQTFMFAIGQYTITEFFAQLYANPSVELEPASAGRSMNGHFGTRSLNADGSWKKLTGMKNSSADISPTAAQMPRLLGLAYASKVYRNNPELKGFSDFSINGNEVAFGTIGDASTSEGIFFETINAAGVLQVPMAISVWDDGYGISVSNKYQTTKQNISEVLKGFEKTDEKDGYLIYTAKGWDYGALCEMYEKGIALCREKHVPVLFHVQEMTQPQGHSTSGSHERYKSKERLKWEDDFDCIKKMREWILQNTIATAEELDVIESDAKKYVNECKKKAWNDFNAPIKTEIAEVCSLFDEIAKQSINAAFINKAKSELTTFIDPSRREILCAVKKVLRYCINEKSEARNKLLAWNKMAKDANLDRYNSNLYSQSKWSALKVNEETGRAS